MTETTKRRIENFVERMDLVIAIEAKFAIDRYSYFVSVNAMIDTMKTAIIYLEPLPDKDYNKIMNHIYQMEHDLSEWYYLRG